MSKNIIARCIFPNLSPIKKMGSLLCPDCHVLMNPYSCQNVIIDKCGQCEGIWFDHKEFSTFKQTLDSYNLSLIKEIYKPTESDVIYLSSCPRCDTSLYEVNYSYDSGVKIKKCDKCRGLWLPIHQTLNLIELAKISQEIAPDVRGLAADLLLHEKERQKNERIKRVGDQLSQRVPMWRFYLARYFAILLPLYDENPRSSFPIVTTGIITINILVFFLMFFTNVPLSELYQVFALQPGEVIKFDVPFTLFTSMFMHAGLMHLIGNMFFLWTFGDNVEEKIGSTNYIFFYLVCGLLASFAQILSAPDSMIPVLGASGAISGILGAYIFLFPHVNIKTLVLGYIVDLPTWFYLGMWAGLQILWVSLYSGKGGGVAWWAHIGGFVFGLLVAFFYKRLHSKDVK